MEQSPIFKFHPFSPWKFKPSSSHRCRLDGVPRQPLRREGRRRRRRRQRRRWLGHGADGDAGGAEALSRAVEEIEERSTCHWIYPLVI